MAYTVLARRYRSRSFDELVGQQAIARTLSNAIEQDRVAHAYLFVGTRGVGKTSAARIFAKAINGGSEDVDEAIMTGRDTDVIEIDAASNSKVEEARELISNAIYRPLRGSKKVYIIDEVHMLSSHAFNALLKTLEEPPDHVIFILCTTETHKVPATIQSRCQRFDFRNLSPDEVLEHLRAVCEQEKIAAEDDALMRIARLANGSMRDGLSLLDRVIAASASKQGVTSDVLDALLGVPERQEIARVIDAVAEGDASTALSAAGDLLARGTPIEQCFTTMVESLRDLMLVVTCGPETDLLQELGDARQQTTDRAAKFDAPQLIHMIALCESGQRLCRSSSTPRALFDAIIARLAMTDRIAEAAAIAGGAPPGKA
ncbi:MAG: DNA polymerase III subunit gamma/tau [Planctomycetota bacterium]